MKHYSSCVWLQVMHTFASWHLSPPIVKSVAHPSPKLERSSALIFRMECLLIVTCPVLFALMKDIKYIIAAVQAYSQDHGALSQLLTPFLPHSHLPLVLQVVHLWVAGGQL